MSNQKKFETYRRTGVLTANRETILLMMYAGALRFLKGAIEAAEKKDIATKNRLITRTQQIVNELRSTLNFDASKEIATHLDMLYGFITQRLIQANAEKDSSEKALSSLNEALGILNTLNSAWEEAVAQIRKDKSQAEKA